MTRAEFEDRTILVTGGAGFIGCHVARSLALRFPEAHVVAMDNLRRRGSELNLGTLVDAGVAFVHGDVRVADDFPRPSGRVALIVDCSADPSVHAGAAGGSRFVVDTNLGGTLNCLEFARQDRSDFIFLSTSRVYPVRPLNEIAVEEWPTRFALSAHQVARGVSSNGVSEDFDLAGVRSLYGATKLASELLIAEYAATYGLRYVINRCGVVTGPGQFGKVDQGVFALWMAKHLFGDALTYRGWGGTGRQLRDLLHVEDLCELLAAQLGRWEVAAGRTYNVGGGNSVSLSLSECTNLCREITGRELPIGSEPDTSPLDVRAYVTDCARVTADTGWTPRTNARETLVQIHRWLQNDAGRLRPLFQS